MRIFPGGLSASFCKVPSGGERASYSALSAKYPDALFFKALGEFDIVAIQEVDAFQSSQILSTSCASVSQCQNLPALRFSSADYSSPDSVVSWIHDAPMASFVLLEFDKYLYTKASPESLVSSFIAHAYGPGDWAEKEMALMVGLGQSELIAIIQSPNPNRLLEFTKYARSLRYEDIGLNEQPADDRDYSVFASTHTTLLAAYSEVLRDDDQSLIEGVVYPVINVICPPGFESRIRDNPFFRGAICESTIGSLDLLIRFPDGIKATELIGGLIKFRAEWEKTSPELVDTSTIVTFAVDGDRASETYLIKELEVAGDLRIVVPGIEEEDSELAADVQSLINRIDTGLKVRASYPSVRQMQHAPSLLYGELQNYLESLLSKAMPMWDQDEEALPGTELETDEPTPLSERERRKRKRIGSSLIRDMVAKAEIGLAQRTGTRFSSAKQSYVISPLYGDGFLAPLLAIEELLRSIFSVLSKGLPELIEYWKGYVFFNDSTGFQAHHGDMFSLPSMAATNPFSPEGSWLTLTHEISHALFTFLAIDEKDQDVFDEAWLRYVGPEEREIESTVGQKIRDEIFELFANWFDFYHFYDENPTRFLNNIWASWGEVSIVHQEPSEYITRTFIVYVLSDLSGYRDRFTRGQEREYLDARWQSFMAACEECIPDATSTFEFSEFKDPVFETATKLIYPFSFIVERYRFDNIRKALNEPYPTLQTHIHDILNGRVISDEIANPYLLLKETHHRLSENASGQNLLSAATLIFSLRSSQEFYTRDLDE